MPGNYLIKIINFFALDPHFQSFFWLSQIKMFKGQRACGVKYESGSITFSNSHIWKDSFLNKPRASLISE